MIICRCNEVSHQEIKQFLQKNPHATLNEVQEATRAGTNCGRCRPLLEKTVEKIKTSLPKDDQLRLF